jgi:hypothetical protein
MRGAAGYMLSEVTSPDRRRYRGCSACGNLRSLKLRTLLAHVTPYMNLTYWVKEVPTPQQAQELLEEHGELPEKWEQPS